MLVAKFRTVYSVSYSALLPSQSYWFKISWKKMVEVCFPIAVFDIVAVYCTSVAQTIILNIIQGLLKFLASASYANIYIYANELFPTNVRNTGMGICSMIARVGAIFGTFCNDYLVWITHACHNSHSFCSLIVYLIKTRIWIHLPTLLYGIVSLIAAVLALMFPETLNNPLPQSVQDVERMDRG